MANNEAQAEELEVLDSIFEDDEAYNKVNDSCIQYKIGLDGSMKSFLIEFVWPNDYPECPPEININTFYNKNLLQEVKEKISSALDEQTQTLIGEAMTFSLIDFAKENQTELLSGQPESYAKTSESNEQCVAKKKEKKPQLTKAQKRRLGDRFGVGEDRPRGWDWVDVIKHLSQTGKANEQAGSLHE